MFDYYKPDPPLYCPVCGVELLGWQGKDGPCGLFHWKQGLPEPIFSESELWKEVLAGEALPKRFEFYTSDDIHWITAEGRLDNDVWASSRVTNVVEKHP